MCDRVRHDDKFDGFVVCGLVRLRGSRFSEHGDGRVNPAKNTSEYIGSAPQDNHLRFTRLIP